MDEKLTELIDKLADKFNTTTEHLWQVMINQAWIDASLGMAWIILGLLIVILSVFLFIGSLKGNRDGDIAALSFGIFIFGVFIIGVNATDVVTGFYNPEYWALKQLIK